jgi:hypothetical protein
VLLMMRLPPASVKKLTMVTVASRDPFLKV